VSQEDEEKALAFFDEVIAREGASVLTVADGYVLGFRRKFLQELLEKHKDQEKLIIFVKHREFKN
jgi:hypothetical protein